MRLKLIPKLVFAALFILAVSPVYSQVGPSGNQGTLPISVGFGFSGFNPGYNGGMLMGGTIWIDFTPPKLPQILRGLALEAEARDLSLNRSAFQVNLREDVASGGVIYSWRNFRNFSPYAKFLMGFGNIDYVRTPPIRSHDTRTVTSLGGGVEYRAYRNVWVRGDYEYQHWPDFWKNTTPAGSLTPQGFTVGATYDFSSSH
jgi:opacity protein-like surface antigen